MNFIFLTIYFIAPLIFVKILILANEKLNRASVVNITALSIYLFSVVGTLPLYFMWDEYRVVTGVVKKEVVLNVLIWSSINLVCFLTGVLFGRRVIRLEIGEFRSAKVQKIESGQKNALALTLIFVAIFLARYISKIPSLAIFVAFFDVGADTTLSRSNMGNSFEGGGYHWYDLVLNNIGLFLVCSIFIIWIQDRNLNNLIFFLITFVMMVFISIMSTEKAPLINLFASLSFSYYLTKKDGVIPKRHFVFFSAVSTVILICMYITFMGADSIAQASSNVISRAFAGSISPAYYYLEYFPSQEGYLSGLSFPNPGGIFPFTPVEFTINVMNWVFPENQGSGVVGTMPTVFWGEAYANFGPLGVPCVGFLIGILVSILTLVVSKMELNPVSLGFQVWLIDHFKKLSQTGFSGYMFDFYLIFTAVAMFLILIVRKRGVIFL
jgi:oligosaccharide repeat unit polymerase